MQTVPLQVIQPQSLVQMGPGGGQLAAIEQDRPQGVVGLELEIGVLDALGQAEEFFSQLPGPLGLCRKLPKTGKFGLASP
jgi:hypothetical protein